MCFGFSDVKVIACWFNRTNANDQTGIHLLVLFIILYFSSAYLCNFRYFTVVVSGLTSIIIQCINQTLTRSNNVERKKRNNNEKLGLRYAYIIT